MAEDKTIKLLEEIRDLLKERQKKTDSFDEFYKRKVRSTDVLLYIVFGLLILDFFFSR